MKEIIDSELLKILACPKCKGAIELDQEHGELLCYQCRLAYEIKDGIPIMLIDEARQLEKEHGQQER